MVGIADHPGEIREKDGGPNDQGETKPFQNLCHAKSIHLVLNTRKGNPLLFGFLLFLGAWEGEEFVELMDQGEPEFLVEVKAALKEDVGPLLRRHEIAAGAAWGDDGDLEGLGFASQARDRRFVIEVTDVGTGVVRAAQNAGDGNA